MNQIDSLKSKIRGRSAALLALGILAIGVQLLNIFSVDVEYREWHQEMGAHTVNAGRFAIHSLKYGNEDGAKLILAAARNLKRIDYFRLQKGDRVIAFENTTERFRDRQEAGPITEGMESLFDRFEAGMGHGDYRLLVGSDASRLGYFGRSFAAKGWSYFFLHIFLFLLASSIIRRSIVEIRSSGDKVAAKNSMDHPPRRAGKRSGG